MGGPKRRLWRKIHIGIDEETLEIRAVEVTSSSIGDAPMLPDLLDRIPPDEKIGSVTGDGAYDTRKCHDAIAGVVMPMLSFHRVRTPNCGSPTRPEPERETKWSEHQSIWGAHCGGKSLDTTAEAASKQNLSGSCCA
jgi:hypothetical protein